MTAETRFKITSAIADCNRYIAKEAPRAADLRPAEVQKRLDWYYEHRAKLLAMLEAAAPVVRPSALEELRFIVESHNSVPS